MESIQQRLTCLLRRPLSFQNIVISLTQGWGLRRGEGGESFSVPACTLTGFGAGEALNPWTDSPAPNTVRSPRPGPHRCRRLLAASLFLSGLLIASLSFPLLFPHFSLSPPCFSSSFSSIFPLSESPPPYLVSTSLSISVLSLLYFSLLGFVCWSFVSTSYLPLSLSPSPALITFISVSTRLSLSLPLFLSLALKRYFPDFGNHPFPRSGGPMDETSWSDQDSA